MKKIVLALIMLFGLTMTADAGVFYRSYHSIPYGYNPRPVPYQPYYPRPIIIPYNPYRPFNPYYPFQPYYYPVYPYWYY